MASFITEVYWELRKLCSAFSSFLSPSSPILNHYPWERVRKNETVKPRNTHRYHINEKARSGHLRYWVLRTADQGKPFYYPRLLSPYTIVQRTFIIPSPPMCGCKYTFEAYAGSFPPFSSCTEHWSCAVHPYVATSLLFRCSAAVMTFFSDCKSLFFSKFIVLMRSLGIVTKSMSSKGWQKYAILYLASLRLLGITTLCTVLFSRPSVQWLSKSPMLTRMGGNSSFSVPFGNTGTGDHVPFDVSISRPLCNGRWKRRVREPIRSTGLASIIVSGLGGRYHNHCEHQRVSRFHGCFDRRRSERVDTIRIYGRSGHQFPKGPKGLHITNGECSPRSRLLDRGEE